MRPLLSIIIPAFNEEARIGPTLDAIVEYLDAQPYSWEVMVVDDGSSDATSERVAERARASTGILLQRIPHRGKGWAVRHGMLAASGAYRLMCDADLAMPVELIASFIERMEDGYDAVIDRVRRRVLGATTSPSCGTSGAEYSTCSFASR